MPTATAVKLQYQEDYPQEFSESPGTVTLRVDYMACAFEVIAVTWVEPSPKVVRVIKLDDGKY